MSNSPKGTTHTSAREKIEKALAESLRLKPYKSISVSELAELAGVSRQAFYLNFVDKDEVLNDLFVRLFSDIMSVVDESDIYTVESLVEVYTEIVEKHSDFLTILADNNLGPFLSRAFVHELIKRDPVLKCQKQPENEAERLYINSFWVSAFSDVYTHWLINGMKTPKDQLNKILTDIMTGNYFN